MKSPEACMMQARVNLAAKSFVYEALVAQLGRHRNLDPARVVDEVERVANFAWQQHPGVFADGRVENVLLDFNDEVAKAEPSCMEVDCFAGRHRPRMLHVASEIYQVGGHSRVLAKWIDRDLASNHCVILTRQPGETSPLLAATCHQRGVKIISLPRSTSKLGRAATIRHLAKQADRVVLHHHPDDAIPILAFANKGGPPVAYFNHAHFWFSLGGTVADITLNTMPFFLRLTERFRFPRATALLSGVSGNREYIPYDKDQAKRDLGLDPDIPVLLTIGTEHYFRPGYGYDFFATLQKVLAACGTLQVLVVGVSSQADFVPQAVVRNKRVRFFGPVADPVPYYHAADVCLESFPMSSLGAFGEAVAYGAAFPIPAYAASENILRLNLPFLASVSPRPENEAQYVKCVAERLEQLPQTHALALGLQAKLQAIDREWPSVLQEVYSKVDGLSHDPGPIPEAFCSFERDHQLMAGLKPFHLPSEIHALFPYVKGLKLNLKSALLGADPLTDALAYELRRLRNGILRRLARR
jgi:hypothetical protein